MTDNNNNKFVDTPEELDPGLAVFHNLAVVVNHLSHSSGQTNKSSSSHAKVCELDTFDGMDPKKLWTFLVQYELCFQDCAKVFYLDRAKVTFAQSYLKDMMLEWFELDLLNFSDLADRPRWMDSWVHFIAELQSMFRPVKSGSTPVGGPVKSGQKQTKEGSRGLDKRLVQPELVTAWIQRLRITSVDPLHRFRSRGVDGDGQEQE